MTIGRRQHSSRPLALVAASGFLMGATALTPAMAADLGGDCCADLEERVSELEATTARKGNRKVSVKISGHIARTLGWYEDEYGDSEWYAQGHGVSGSRLKISGKAALTSTWTAGYQVRFRFRADRNKSSMKRAGESFGPSGNIPVKIDRNYVYLKHKRYGTFVLGHAGAPTGSIANISLGGHAVTGDADGEDWNGSSINGFHLAQDLGHQAVAWISPTLRGFTFAIAWSDLDIDVHNAGPDVATRPMVGGSDDAVDVWDMALRYAQEFGPIRIAGGIGYTTTDNNELDLGSNIMGSVALMHTPTGLNVNFSAGAEIDGGLPNIGDNGTKAYAIFGPAAGDQQFWYISGGINRDFTGYGNTSLYGEYGHYDYDNAGICR